MWLGIVYSFSFQENGRFYLLYFVDDEEDDNEKFELSGMMRVKMLFELVVEKNFRNGNVYEQRIEFQLFELFLNGVNGGVLFFVEN